MVKLVYVRSDPRCAVSTQLAAAREWGVVDDNHIWKHKTGQETMRDFLDTIRLGDEVGIYRLDLLAPRGSKTKQRPARELRSIVDRLFSVGVKVTELETGRTCSDRQELIAMYDDAIHRFGSNRGSTSKRPGRKPFQVYTPEQVEHIKLLWNDARNTSVPHKVAAVQEHYPKFNKSVWYRAGGQFK